MKREFETPKRLERAMGAQIEVDVPNRILKRVQFVTRKIASDGGIVDPAGINIKVRYEQNPVVLLMHGRTEAFPVIGRSLALKMNALGMEAETQFADNALGRDIAYLYGVNDKKEVYARGWSFGWDTQAVETWTLEHAKQWLETDYVEEEIPESVKRWGEVWVCLRCIMNEYSAVALGADKDALSRAFASGVRTAGTMVADLDFMEAGALLARVRSEHDADRLRIEKLEKDIQALRRDGSAAAARGDSAEILQELQAWVGELKQK